MSVVFARGIVCPKCGLETDLRRGDGVIAWDAHRQPVSIAYEYSTVCCGAVAPPEGFVFAVSTPNRDAVIHRRPDYGWKVSYD